MSHSTNPVSHARSTSTLRAVRAWHAQRKHAYLREQAMGLVIERAHACGEGALPWDISASRFKDELMVALSERSGAFILWARGCRRVARAALLWGLDADGCMLD